MCISQWYSDGTVSMYKTTELNTARADLIAEPHGRHLSHSRICPRQTETNYEASEIAQVPEASRIAIY